MILLLLLLLLLMIIIIIVTTITLLIAITFSRAPHFSLQMEALNGSQGSAKLTRAPCTHEFGIWEHLKGYDLEKLKIK